MSTEPTPRQKSSALGLLRWLREKTPLFSNVLLKEYVEDQGEVSVFAVLTEYLAAAFQADLAPKLTSDQGAIDEQRRQALGRVLRSALTDAPELLGVELTFADYSREEPEDFDPADGPLVLPWGAFLIFKLARKTAKKTLTKTATADDPDSDAGGPGYVQRAYPALAEEKSVTAVLSAVGFDKADIDPDWLLWKPAPSPDDRVARLLQDTCQLIRPSWPRLEDLAASLRAAGHTTLTGAVIDADNVRRVLISAELLLGNTWPSRVQ